ncbi:uncharacterized protein LOC123676694 [Harmonia axyridis]|uniref:uncharacterized protein LOC123676694 n=1 Tax=Harmonia axyridis TaxID=115357 RepID=UPI001E275227|nr:uncharacterized protein LOC123676694 [Harmonia axyridis]
MLINPWILIAREPTIIMDQWMLVIWMTLRTSQLFLLIEPIHGVLSEHAKTKFLIIQLMKQAKDGQLRKQTELFTTQYQMWNIEFNSVDMIPLQRTIYAAVS